MAPIHIPRVFASIASGFRKKSAETMLGFGPAKPHKYTSRVGIFDVDYLAHMNNAAFLAHAEYARWEMLTENGLLKKTYDRDTHFMVAGVAVRYRREVRPLFRTFRVESYVAGLDERYLWIYQTFRYPEEGNNRIRAQVLIQGVATQNRKVLDPRHFFKDLGYDPAAIDSLSRGKSGDETVDGMLSTYEKLDLAFRDSASADDSRRAEK